MLQFKLAKIVTLKKSQHLSLCSMYVFFCRLVKKPEGLVVCD